MGIVSNIFAVNFFFICFVVVGKFDKVDYSFLGRKKQK